MKLLIATSNPGKIKEIKEVIGHLDLEILSPKDLSIHTDVEETGTTYKENARIKAEFFYQQAQIPTVAEDSGIVIDALKDQLGVHTRRWGAGASASDQEWIEHFLNVMQQFPQPHQRQAKFISHLYYIDSNLEVDFLGETTGQITTELEAPIEAGIPISACFRPEGCYQVYSALSIQEKNQLSHRGKSTHQLLDFLEKQLNG